jgi:hypothetical protein
MDGNGQADAPWGYAVERGHPMLEAALCALGRSGVELRALPACRGPACEWARAAAACLARGACRGVVLFCTDALLACCVANKVPGVRAAAVWTVPQAERAVRTLGANLLAVEPDGRTFFEFKHILQLCCTRAAAGCPPVLASVLEELDGHAHR